MQNDAKNITVMFKMRYRHCFCSAICEDNVLKNNHLTLSDYNTKPVRGDCAIFFEIARVHLKLHGFT